MNCQVRSLTKVDTNEDSNYFDTEFVNNVEQNWTTFTNAKSFLKLFQNYAKSSNWTVDEKKSNDFLIDLKGKCFSASDLKAFPRIVALVPPSNSFYKALDIEIDNLNGIMFLNLIIFDYNLPSFFKRYSRQYFVHNNCLRKRRKLNNPMSLFLNDSIEVQQALNKLTVFFNTKNKTSDKSERFSAVALRTNENSIVSALYGSSIQCQTCGLRQPSQCKMDQHLDWHFRLNKLKQRRREPGSGTISRNWFLEQTNWNKCNIRNWEKENKEMSQFVMMEKKRQELEHDQTNLQMYNCLADDNQDKCLICFDEFETFWNDKLSNWMFKGAFRVGTDEIECDITERVKAINKMYSNNIIHYECFCVLVSDQLK
jgi:hypothetical protein